MSVFLILSVTFNILGNFSKVKGKSFYFFYLIWLAVSSVVLFWVFNLINVYLLQFLLLLNSFPTIIKIKKSYIQTTIFFIYFQKQTIGCMKLNSIYFMFISIGQKWCNCVQELIIMQNYTSQLIGFPQLCRNFTNYDIVIKAVLNGSWASAQKPKNHCWQLLVGNELRHLLQTECNKLNTILHQVNGATFQPRKILQIVPQGD